jgi:hypothetical protein
MQCNHMSQKEEKTQRTEYEIRECFRALAKQVRRFVGNIREIALSTNFDCTEPTDLIVATDGSVLLGVV